MTEKYNHFFDIDTEYFPTVNEGAMQKDPDLWKKFYPHESFVKLLNTTIKILGREGGKPKGIWVHGSYGTGKSHAVLTLKKLLDATAHETREYFNENSELLSGDMLNRLQLVKQSGKVLTVHRYGSSNIRSDNQLVTAIQEQIMHALKDAGMSFIGTNSLRDSILEWLNKSSNRKYFKDLIEGEYIDLFGGLKVDDVIQRLKCDDIVQDMMLKIMEVGEQEHIQMFKLDVDGLKSWIKDIISTHDLKGILFIWDEFSEYLNNNKADLTGFQSIVELSQEAPFYMMIVVHKGGDYFGELDNRRKIFDRFEKPMCEISLPEHMAFKLMDKAMRRTSDCALLREWNGCINDLYCATTTARETVKKKASLSDDELKSILPMQPYTAIFLKNIATSFKSNQRSMFDFIKNSDNREYHGFQWFIDEYGPYDDDPLFMLDMLWDFFYEKGKNDLEEKVRSVLSYFERFVRDYMMTDEEKRVLKCILLLQAVYEKTNSDIFMPSEKNIAMAFEGSDTFKGGKALELVHVLENKQIIYKRTTNKISFYNARIQMIENDELAKLIEKMRLKKTEEIANGGEEILGLSGGLNLRCRMQKLTDDGFTARMNRLRMSGGNRDTHIDVAITFAKNEEEADSLRQKISQNSDFGGCIIVDTSATPMGSDAFEQWTEHLANSDYYKAKDKQHSEQYNKYAQEIIDKWYARIKNGDFIVYCKENPQGKRLTNVDQIGNELLSIVRMRHPWAIDVNFKASDTLWGLANNYKTGVQCAIERKLERIYKSSNASMNVEKQLGNAWGCDYFWTSDAPQMDTACANVMKEIKLLVEDVIQKSFEATGRVALNDIYEALEDKRVAILPCNLTAFVLGFVLREYAGSNYSWSNEMTSDVMSDKKLGELIENLLKQKIQPDNRNIHPYYIVKDKEEIRQFRKQSAEIFSSPQESCDTLEHTREAIREKMKSLSYPLWTLKYIFENEKLRTSASVLGEVIDSYVLFLNNTDKSQSENDIAIKIGRQFMNEVSCPNDLKQLVKNPKLKSGMKKYISSYQKGKLEDLAGKIHDTDNKYLDSLKKRFTKEANWVWSQATVNEKIDEVISEYEMILASEPYIVISPDVMDVGSRWKARCQELRLPEELVEDKVSDATKKLLRILLNYCSSGSFRTEDYCEMTAILTDNMAEVSRFFDYNNQFGMFKEIFGNDLSELSEEDKQTFFENCKRDVWMQNSQYFNEEMRKDISRFVNDSAMGRLKALWRSKAENTDSPSQWSKKYMMPILCMFEGDEQRKAEEMFEVLNRGTSNYESILEVQVYLENADFFERLSDQRAREKSFRQAIIGKYDVLCDYEEVKEHLAETGEAPYSWSHSPRISDEIKKLAKQKYTTGGSRKAIERIDEMDPAELKKYLKQLIEDNLDVGMEIIRNQKDN